MRNTDQIIEAARSWAGTPYGHQHRAKGHLVDCVGLIIGVGLEAGVLPTWSPEAWGPFADYGRRPNPSHMRKAIAAFLTPLDVPTDEIGPDGAVAFMGWRTGLPMHLAIAASDRGGRRTMIHAFAHVGRVVEHGFSHDWRDRVESWWSYPGILEY